MTDHGARRFSDGIGSEYPELHEAALSCLQRISLLISAGNVEQATSELHDLLDAFDQSDEHDLTG